MQQSEWLPKVNLCKATDPTTSIWMFGSYTFWTPLIGTLKPSRLSYFGKQFRSWMRYWRWLLNSGSPTYLTTFYYSKEVRARGNKHVYLSLKAKDSISTNTLSSKLKTHSRVSTNKLFFKLKPAQSCSKSRQKCEIAFNFTFSFHFFN